MNFLEERILKDGIVKPGNGFTAHRGVEIRQHILKTECLIRLTVQCLMINMLRLSYRAER